jgi:hypothetical protein
MKPLERVSFLGLGLLILIAGCAADECCLSEPPVESQDREYQLEAHLGRDFMPPTPPDGRPLVASIRVIEQHGKPIPSGYQLTDLWVINEDQVWVTTLSDEGQPHEQHEILGIARDGPKWGPDIFVDVIVAMDKGDGDSELLRAVDERIYRTD